MPRISFLLGRSQERRIRAALRTPRSRRNGHTQTFRLLEKHGVNAVHIYNGNKQVPEVQGLARAHWDDRERQIIHTALASQTYVITGDGTLVIQR